MRKKGLLALEFGLLFFGIPLFVFLDKDFLHPSILVLPVLVFVFLLLKNTTDFNWRELFRWGISKKILVKNGIIVLCSLLLMLSYMLIFDRGQLFNLPRSHPWVFLAMCLFYPIFSAFGQEVIYRTFLFRRYESLFRADWLLTLFSGLTFSFLHIVYYDPVSMILTFMGGIWFARVYQQTRSVLFTAVLHGVMGILIFGVGLGRYFWLDMPG
ncbi:MAG: CPBP family intramembrane metalloprotease [Bacteroides sp.]|nr:CPBP family intramembrane metalloprotease [Bacteroides sp.]